MWHVLISNVLHVPVTDCEDASFLTLVQFCGDVTQITVVVVKQLIHFIIHRKESSPPTGALYPLQPTYLADLEISDL